MRGMKIVRMSIYVVLSMLILSACGARHDSSEFQSNNQDDEIEIKEETVAFDSQEMGEKSAKSQNDDNYDNTGTQINNKKNDSRMVIYTAELQLKVEKFIAAEQTLTKQAETYGGYVVESHVISDDEKQLSGSLTVRIPTKKFTSFLEVAEGTAVEVIERNVNGQDVTEEYVDLESRLHSKRVVEERLLQFMKEANKTEDLLKISSDLAKVQEEIEKIVGKMNYLENQTELSTITIFIYEDNIVVPDITKDKLNTWERTKQQFIISINMLLAVCSSIFVFTIGNLPVIFLSAMIVYICVYVYRKIIRKNRTDINNNQKNDA